MAKIKTEQSTTENTETNTGSKNSPRRVTKRGVQNGAKRNTGKRKKQRYWSRRPVAEQLLKKALPEASSSGITVYFITGKGSILPHKL